MGRESRIYKTEKIEQRTSSPRKISYLQNTMIYRSKILDLNNELDISKYKPLRDKFNCDCSIILNVNNILTMKLLKHPFAQKTKMAEISPFLDSCYFQILFRKLSNLILSDFCKFFFTFNLFYFPKHIRHRACSINC